MYEMHLALFLKAGCDTTNAQSSKTQHDALFIYVLLVI
jgi:hypothetical protein